MQRLGCQQFPRVCSRPSRVMSSVGRRSALRLWNRGLNRSAARTPKSQKPSMQASPSITFCSPWQIEKREPQVCWHQKQVSPWPIPVGSLMFVCVCLCVVWGWSRSILSQYSNEKRSILAGEMGHFSTYPRYPRRSSSKASGGSSRAKSKRAVEVFQVEKPNQQSSVSPSHKQWNSCMCCSCTTGEGWKSKNTLKGCWFVAVHLFQVLIEFDAIAPSVTEHGTWVLEGEVDLRIHSSLLPLKGEITWKLASVRQIPFWFVTDFGNALHSSVCLKPTKPKMRRWGLWCAVFRRFVRLAGHLPWCCLGLAPIFLPLKPVLMGSSMSNPARDPSQIRSILPRWIATAESGAVLENHVLCIENGRIAAILPKAQFGGEPDLQLPTHILIPGLINAHTHTPMSLLRGYADDLPLNEWLFQHIFPTEGKFVFEAPVDEAKEFVRRGSELACYEMLKTGTTIFNDMYFHGDATASVARQAGMKAVLTQAGLLYFGDDAAFTALVKQNVDFALAASKDTHIRPSLLPHSVYMVPEEKLQEVKTAYDEACAGSHVVIHTHLHETKKEIDDVAKTGKSAVQVLDSLGMLNSRTVAAHCVHMTDEEIKLMADRKANVAHCPRSNLKLGSGIARVAAMLEAGVNVCLGTDGASSNNTLDMLTETLGLTWLAWIFWSPGP